MALHHPEVVVAVDAGNQSLSGFPNQTYQVILVSKPQVMKSYAQLRLLLLQHQAGLDQLLLPCTSCMK